MFIWDVEADVWSRGPDMITARTLTMATVYTNKIYVIGGSGGADSNTAVESYNVLTNEWQAETSLPDSRWQSLAAAPVGGGRIYAVGGNSNGGALATIVSLPVVDTPEVASKSANESASTTSRSSRN